MSDTDALNRWQAQFKHLMHAAVTADIFVKSLNDNMHKNKAKELEVYMYVHDGDRTRLGRAGDVTLAPHS